MDPLTSDVTVDAMMQGLKRGCARGLAAAGLVAVTAGGGAAQAEEARPWRSAWTVGLESSYDHNPFRLTAGQRDDLLDGGGQYESLSQPYDMRNTLRLGLGLRGRGFAGRRLNVESDVRVDLYTFNRRRSSVSVDLAATQKLSKRDGVRFAVELTPSEFRRNYVAGADGGGGPLFEAGVATTLEGELAYERRVLRGRKGGPELDVEVALTGGTRSYRDMPWRDRVELGGGVEADLEAGRLGLELSASHARAMDGHEGAEPVLTDGTVVMAPLQRGFGQTELGAEATFRMSRGTRIGLDYELRERRYSGSLSEDPYYGGREDRRHTAGASLRFDVGAVKLVLGGEHQVQTSFRPGRGDTGDEADYNRTRVSVRVEYGR